MVGCFNIDTSSPQYLDNIEYIGDCECIYIICWCCIVLCILVLISPIKASISNLMSDISFSFVSNDWLSSHWGKIQGRNIAIFLHFYEHSGRLTIKLSLYLSFSGNIFIDFWRNFGILYQAERADIIQPWIDNNISSSGCFWWGTTNRFFSSFEMWSGLTPLTNVSCWEGDGWFASKLELKQKREN